MKMNRDTIPKTAGALLLSLLLAVTMVFAMPQQAMADGGNATVTLGKVKGLSAGTEFEFEIFKVGHYTNTGAFALDDAVKDAHVKLDYKKDDAEGWLASAWSLAEYIDNNGIELESLGKYNLKPGESFTKEGLVDGLYLVKSKTVRDSKSELTNWTPRPVYIAILGGDSTITLDNNVVIKIVRTAVTINHRVTKIWSIPSGKEKSAKPSEINVNIRYGGKIIDTIKLNSGNNWTYAWSSEEDGDKYKYISEDGDKEVRFTPANNSHKWTCDEIFTEKSFREAYGRAPSKDEAAALAKLNKCFTVEVLADTVAAYEVDDPVTQKAQVTQHRIKNTYVPPKTPPEKPDTGDETNIRLWAGALAVAAMLLIVIFVYRWRRKEK